MCEYSYTRAYGIHPGYLIWDQLSEEQKEEVQKIERQQWTKMVRKVHFNNTIYDIPEGMEYSIEEWALPIPFFNIKFKKIVFYCVCGWKFDPPTSPKRLTCPNCQKVIKAS